MNALTRLVLVLLVAALCTYFSNAVIMTMWIGASIIMHLAGLSLHFLIISLVAVPGLLVIKRVWRS